MRTLQAPLRTTDLLADLLSADPSRLATHQSIQRCHRLALAYLRRRARGGRLDTEMFGVSLEDLALDCVADLFRRDEDGRFDQLCSYFEGMNWEKMDDEGLQMALRRVVFSAVNEGLFRRYREWDPSLGRLIRTLKRHVKRSDGLALERRRAALFVELAAYDDECLARPNVAGEILEAYLHKQVGGDASVGTVLVALEEFFEQTDLYAPRVGLTELALSVRSMLTRLEAQDEDADVSYDANVYDETDLSEAVRANLNQCMGDVQQGMESFYVERRGLNPELYNAYFSVIEDVLTSQFVDDGAVRESLRVALCRYIGDISSPDYRKEHQAVLEYLVKLTQSRLFERVPALLGVHA